MTTLEAFADVRVRPGTAPAQASWEPVCLFDDLEPEWGEAVLIAGRQLALFRLWDDTVWAIDNLDPATGAHVLSRGIVGSRGDRPTVASPLLKHVYDLETGECLSHPGLRVATYPAQIVGNAVEIMIPTS